MVAQHRRGGTSEDPSVPVDEEDESTANKSHFLDGRLRFSGDGGMDFGTAQGRRECGFEFAGVVDFQRSANGSVMVSWSLGVVFGIMEWWWYREHWNYEQFKDG